jgi:hypothetical protein
MLVLVKIARRDIYIMLGLVKIAHRGTKNSPQGYNVSVSKNSPQGYIYIYI